MLRHGRHLLWHAFAHSAREQLAADYSQVGLIGTVNYLPYMFAPFFVSILLDRLNKSYVLLSGILLNVFSIFLLSIVQSILEIMLYRALTGVAHALFWPSCEVLISISSSMDRRVRNISVFIAAWIFGFHGWAHHREISSKCI
jgi:MFS family permease